MKKLKNPEVELLKSQNHHTPELSSMTLKIIKLNTLVVKK
jgi:hypothetical protein